MENKGVLIYKIILLIMYNKVAGGLEHISKEDGEYIDFTFKVLDRLMAEGNKEKISEGIKGLKGILKKRRERSSDYVIKEMEEYIGLLYQELFLIDYRNWEYDGLNDIIENIEKYKSKNDTTKPKEVLTIILEETKKWLKNDILNILEYDDLNDYLVEEFREMVK